jgi:hypothetical protein
MGYYIGSRRTGLSYINSRKANWISHILRRNCFIKHIIETKIEGRIDVVGRRERRRKQLPDELKK